MPNIQIYNVAPAMPEGLVFLEILAHNLWWCWNADAVELFRRIDPPLWRETGHNPLSFLSAVPQNRLEALAGSEGFLNHLDEVRRRFRARVEEPCLASEQNRRAGCIAYFSLEYGIHESLRLYSGGLGLLAGDHLKAASDLGLPLVAVGLMYRQGYFQQYLDSEGRQQERFAENEVHRLPVKPTLDGEGRPVEIAVPMPDGELRAQVWRLDVGRVPLFLLDVNIPANPPHFRDLGAQLYAGDRRTRLRQELLLGVGGFDMLLALGYEPKVCHINEGHAAFLVPARVAHLVRALDLPQAAAEQVVQRSTVFTTHTPVPAGNEMFAVDLLRPHLEALQPKLGLSGDDVLAWGMAPDHGASHELCMTILGLRMARFSNGVSELHGCVAREMWNHLWPRRARDEVPITHVTNGVHVPSWLSASHTALYARYLGPEWSADPGSQEACSLLKQIPDDELWRVHELARSQLVRFVREHLERQMRVRNATRAEIAQAKSVLDHDALTIGFARRFATYKRATLLLRDAQRLESLLADEERPVQILFAGKAHPADEGGKAFIREIVQFARRPQVRRRVVFLENYDINVARHMVQGVDVWLNSPRRPLEASGTSGMKAAVNGAIHCSVLDGWWCEGYSRYCGWAIGGGETYPDPEYQDDIESQALFNVLENEVVPTFYERGAGDLPEAWIRMMKASIRMAMGFFTSHRMVDEYHSRFYGPALQAYHDLTADGARRARELVDQRQRLDKLWSGVRIDAPVYERDISSLHSGDRFGVTSRVHLGELQPDEVDVQLYYGPLDSKNRIRHSNAVSMALREALGQGAYVYAYELECEAPGRYGFTTRVTPRGGEWKHAMPGFVTWADGVS